MTSLSGVIMDATGTRVFPFLLLLAGLVALVIACGGSSPAAVSTSEPLSLGQTPLELLKHSTASMRTVESFRAHADMEIETLGENIPISMEMEVSRNDRVHNILVIATPGGEQTIEMVIAEPHAYAKISGQGWIRMDLGALAALSGQSEQVFTDARGFFNSFSS